jgi:hypothetical protein
MGIRTPDIQLAKLALYQLSYTPRGACGTVSHDGHTALGQKFAGGEWVKIMLYAAGVEGFCFMRRTVIIVSGIAALTYPEQLFPDPVFKVSS